MSTGRYIHRDIKIHLILFPLRMHSQHLRLDILPIMLLISNANLWYKPSRTACLHAGSHSRPAGERNRRRASNVHHDQPERTSMEAMTALISCSFCTSHCAANRDSSFAPSAIAADLNSSSFAFLLAQATTFIPAAASATAHALPIPADAPVTIATLPSRSPKHGAVCKMPSACRKQRSSASELRIPFQVNKKQC